jgi:hypothetical protein
LGERERAVTHAAMALAIFERDAWWRSLAERYGVDYMGLLSLPVDGHPAHNRRLSHAHSL